MMKFHVGLLIVFCTVEFIDASCLSYGHSCWGAHGKRSNIPQREMKPVEANDRWGLFKIMPERNNVYQFKKFLQENPNIQGQNDNDLNTLNFPVLDQKIQSFDDSNLNDDKDINRNELIGPETEELQQRHQSGRVPFQIVHYNKPNFEQ